MVSSSTSQPDKVMELCVRTFHEALSAIGGRRADLATYLGVSPRELRSWLAGSDTPPFIILVKAMQIIRDGKAPGDATPAGSIGANRRRR